MKWLHLLRHAKSSRKENGEDYERPLSRGGRETARRVGRDFPTTIGNLDLVLCSSARRTRETLDLVLAGYSPRPRTVIEDALYLVGRDRLLQRLCRLDAHDTKVLLIGHNPALHELAVALAEKTSPDFEALASGKFPTAARASFEIGVDWPALSVARHRLIAYITPKG